MKRLEFFHIHDKYASKKEVPFYEFIYFKNKYLVYILEVHIKPFLRKYNPHHFVEKQFNFDPNVLTLKSGYVEGYFQTEKYFKDFENEIRKDFTFILPLSKKSEEIRWKIENSNSVSIHIRRGDYLKGNNLNYHWICSIDYYKKAIDYLESKQKNLTYFFFSDDIERVKQNFSLENAYYIDWNTWVDSRQDMQLMSLCKHNIIANSSFSRRWAWLNKNLDKVVVAPQKRTLSRTNTPSDIIPNTRFTF